MIALQKSQPHPRRIIRARVHNLLKTGTDLAGRWFCSRPDPTFVNELPCGLVYFTDEPADHKNTAPRVYDRTLLLVTEVLQMGEPEEELTLDDWFDSRAFEIEHVFLQDRQLGLTDIVSDSKLVRTQPTQLDFGGETVVASIRLYWEIDWSVDYESGINLAEFLRFTATHNASGAIAVDDVTIRED
jgi:hypothetical protein